MRTLEMALKAEDRHQRWYAVKLKLDVWLQASLYAFVLVAAFLGHGEIMFYGHYFVLGAYQVLSSQLHPTGKFMQNQRLNYNRCLVFHLMVIVPSAILVVPMFVILVTTALQAFWYFYITIKEFSQLK